MTREEAWAALDNDCDVSSAARYLVSVIEDEAVKAERARCLRAAEGWSDTSAGKGIAEAIRGGERQAPAWTTAAPSVPGWYWWRAAHAEARVVEVVEFPWRGTNALMAAESPIGPCWVSSMGGEWCGPLPVPGEGSQ